MIRIYFLILLEVVHFFASGIPIPTTAIISRNLQQLYYHKLSKYDASGNGSFYEPRSLLAKQQQTYLHYPVKAAAIVLLNFPVIAVAREKGAFEMDAEFYIKDLLDAVGLKGSKTSGTQNGFQKKPIYKSPRTLDRKFVSNIVNIIASSIAQVSKSTQAADIVAAVITETDSAVQSFKTFVPITAMDITDQYYFDMLLYLYYIEAGKLLPTSEERSLIFVYKLQLFIKTEPTYYCTSTFVFKGFF